MENDVLLKVQNLVVHYETHNAVVEAVNNVSFEIRLSLIHISEPTRH